MAEELHKVQEETSELNKKLRVYKSVNKKNKKRYSSLKKRRDSSKKKKLDLEYFAGKIEETITRKMRKIEDLTDLENDKMRQECTFAPAICNKSRSMVETKQIKPIYERYILN